MKRCSVCGNWINRGNRADKCEKCQKECRKQYVKNYNNELGSARMTKDIYQWSKWIATLDNDTIVSLVAAYRQRLKQNYFSTQESLQYKTMLKLLTKQYENNKATKKPEEKIIDRSKEAIALETVDVKWKKAEYGWVDFYDDGIVTLSPKLFFSLSKRKIKIPKTLKQIYWSWRKGYVTK